jgi:transmembrane 9 superfamily protein 2/4
VRSDFYDNRLPFPTGAYEKQAAESLGSVLAGDRLWTSSVELYMHQNVSCQQWGDTVTLTKDQIEFTSDLIDQSYLINWLVDGLPAAEMKVDVNDGQVFNSVGFELGQVEIPLNRPSGAEDPAKRLVSTVKLHMLVS